MSKQNRETLKGYFNTGDKPTEEQFSNFIESTLNQIDDGIEKPSGSSNPLKITAQGEKENLLDFYAGDTNTWSINQKPDNKQIGLNISNSQGSKLFIASSNGNVGIGTTTPNAKLEVNGNLKVTKRLEIESNQLLGFMNFDKKNPPNPDTFDYDGKEMGHYTLKWATDTWEPEGNTFWISGYGGIKLFTGFVDGVQKERFSINRNGNVRYSVSFDKDSSRDLKDNIVGFSAQEAFKTLAELDPIKYTLKADSTQRVHLGFIAEESPSLVTSQDGKAITHDHILTVLTTVVKQQQQTILAMGEKIKALEELCGELAKNNGVASKPESLEILETETEKIEN